MSCCTCHLGTDLLIKQQTKAVTLYNEMSQDCAIIRGDAERVWKKRSLVVALSTLRISGVVSVY